MGSQVRLLIAAVVVAFTAAACASSSVVVTGTTRDAVAPSMVQLYPRPPADYEVIGVVRASSEWGWNEQGSMNYALEELKKQAAAIGANGLLVKAVGGYGGYAASVVGEAIYVRH